jgi:hypothetical protein
VEALVSGPDLESLVAEAKSAAEQNVDAVLALAADPSVDDAALRAAMRAAQILVDAVCRDGLNLIGAQLSRWRSARTRVLLDAARARFGPQQQAVKPLDWTPL